MVDGLVAWPPSPPPPSHIAYYLVDFQSEGQQTGGRGGRRSSPVAYYIINSSYSQKASGLAAGAAISVALILSLYSVYTVQQLRQGQGLVRALFFTVLILSDKERRLSTSCSLYFTLVKDLTCLNYFGIFFSG
jgi:hypothetical protein